MSKNTASRRADHMEGHRNVYDRNRKRLITLGKADNTPCAICGKPIDYSLKPPNPLSVSVDHIIPISRGGHPSDLDNLQLTHLCCNVSKSNKLTAKNNMKQSQNSEKSEKNEQKNVISMRNLPQNLDGLNYKA